MPENHLAYFVSEIVDRLDLQKFYARYEGDGRRNQPYDPAMLVKILVYGYATGVFYGGLRVVGLFKTPAHLRDWGSVKLS